MHRTCFDASWVPPIFLSSLQPSTSLTRCLDPADAIPKEIVGYWMQCAAAYTLLLVTRRSAFLQLEQAAFQPFTGAAMAVWRMQRLDMIYIERSQRGCINAFCYILQTQAPYFTGTILLLCVHMTLSAAICGMHFCNASHRGQE